MVFSVMKRITNMYPNTFYESENIQALTRKLGNLKYNQDTKERNNTIFKFNLCTVSIMG